MMLLLVLTEFSFSGPKTVSAEFWANGISEKRLKLDQLLGLPEKGAATELGFL